MSLRRTLGALLCAGALSVGLAGPAWAGRDFIDVSSNNPYPQLIDYAQAHSRIAVKANEGTGYVWSQHSYISDQAHEAGLQVWHYDFARPSLSQSGDGAHEAALLVRLAAAHWRTGDRIVLDLESSDGLTDGAVAAWLRAYEQTAEKAGLGPLVVYSGWWFVGPRPLTLAAVGGRDFWFAAYQASAPDYHGLHAVAWQYTDRGTVAGESAPVDVSHDLVPAPKPGPCDAFWWVGHGCLRAQSIPAGATGVSLRGTTAAYWTNHGWWPTPQIPSDAQGVLHFRWVVDRGWQPA